MGTNFHVPWDANTEFSPNSMNGVPQALDKALSYAKNVMVYCGAGVCFDKTTGKLAWGGQITVAFNREDGKTITNKIAAGSIALTVGQFAYVDLNDADGTVLTVSTASVTPLSASNVLYINRLVLGYRDVGGFFGAALNQPLSGDTVLQVQVKQAVTPGQLICLKADGYYPADNAGLATCQDILLTLQSGAANSTVMALDRGIYTGFSGLVPGGSIYVGGAVAAIKTITVATNPTTSDTLTIGGKTYNFVASGASGDQINLGADPSATAANINAKLNADAATTLCTGAVAANKVTCTANTAGVDFLLTADGTRLVAATTRPNAVSGSYTQTMPTGSGKIVKCIGWAVNAATIKFCPDTHAIQLT